MFEVAWISVVVLFRFIELVSCNLWDSVATLFFACSWQAYAEHSPPCVCTPSVAQVTFNTSSADHEFLSPFPSNSVTKPFDEKQKWGKYKQNDSIVGPQFLARGIYSDKSCIHHKF